MSNQVMNVPAHIQARLAARKDSEQKSSLISAIVSDGFSFPKVSIRASRFRLVEDGVETPVGITLDVVIVGVSPHVAKVFYSKPFNGDLNVRPDCFSHDGLRPDASVQSPVSTNCQTCPHNVLGSKVNPSGAKSKMCGDQRHLAVVAAADPTKVYELVVPVSGMKALREYFKYLQNYGLSPEEVITELGFDENANFPKITFAHKGYVPEKAIDRVDTIVQSDEVKEVIRLIPPSNRLPAPTAPAAEAPQQVQRPVPQAAPVAPLVEDGYEDDAVASATVVEQAPVQQAASKSQRAPKPTTQAAPAVAADIPGVSAIESKLDDIFGDA